MKASLVKVSDAEVGSKRFPRSTIPNLPLCFTSMQSESLSQLKSDGIVTPIFISDFSTKEFWSL